MSEQTQVNETVEQEVSQQQLINEAISNPEVLRKLDIFANHIAEVSHNNWITIAQMQKKSRVKDETELTTFLDLLILTKKAFVKNNKGIIKYKITTTPEVRKRVLVTQIAEYKNAIELLEAELISLS